MWSENKNKNKNVTLKAKGRRLNRPIYQEKEHQEQPITDWFVGDARWMWGTFIHTEDIFSEIFLSIPVKFEFGRNGYMDVMIRNIQIGFDIWMDIRISKWKKPID